MRHCIVFLDEKLTRNPDKQSQDSIYQSNASMNSLQDIEDETNIQYLDDKELSEEGKDDGQEQVILVISICFNNT
ncbi:hypothetical protein IC575_015081 [Cucumis melo]